MISKGTHSIRVTPELIQLCRDYADHYSRCAQDKVEEYQATLGEGHTDGLRPIVEDHEVVIAARREIAKATVVQEALSVLQSELERIYTFHYEQLAEVFRTARKELGFDRLDHSPHLHLIVLLTMAMLKAENSKFSEEKFINYINN
jgi:hypothetical protein